MDLIKVLGAVINPRLEGHQRYNPVSIIFSLLIMLFVFPQATSKLVHSVQAGWVDKEGILGSVQSEQTNLRQEQTVLKMTEE